jgi:hypothetical protein
MYNVFVGKENAHLSRPPYLFPKIYMNISYLIKHLSSHTKCTKTDRKYSYTFCVNIVLNYKTLTLMMEQNFMAMPYNFRYLDHSVFHTNNA